MEKGSKRPGNNRDKGNSYKKDTERTGSNKAYSKRDSSKTSRDARPENDRGAKKTFSKGGSFGSDRPKRAFTPRDGESDKPRKQWDREAGKDGDKPYKAGAKRSFDKPRRDEDGGGERVKRSFDKPRSFERPATGDKPAKRYGDSKPGGRTADRKPFSERPKRDFDKPGRRDGDERAGRSEREKKPFEKTDRPVRARKGPDEREERPERDRKPFDKTDRPVRSRKGPDEREATPGRDRKPFDKTDRPVRSRKGVEDREERPDREKRSFSKTDKPARARADDDKKTDSRPFRERTKPATPRKPKHEDDEDSTPVKREFKSHKIFEKEANFDKPQAEDVMPLNKYIAHSGECSRRDAAELVRQGKVKVNGELILDPGHKVKLEDDVTLIGKKLKPQKGMVYILLNKPKGFITTNEDPQGRKTVMDLVSNSGVDRLFAVGRLDRNTTGLLLMTNDGLLAQKLAHPSYQIKKVYQVTLDKPITKADFDKVIEGVTLDDGIAHVDALAYLESKNELGLEIHSGRNRIVRRIFESLGYVVEKLDRVMYAGLTKKNLPRSKWRFLDEREIVLLKHFKS